MAEQTALFDQYETEYCSISTDVSKSLQDISTLSPGKLQLSYEPHYFINIRNDPMVTTVDMLALAVPMPAEVASAVAPA